MSKVLIALVLLLIGGGAFLLLRSKSSSPALPQPQPQPTSEQTSTPTETFSEPKKSAHYESNTPEHGTTFAGIPVNTEAVMMASFNSESTDLLQVDLPI